MSLSNNFPNLKPTLLLDFANTKQLDPRITFTRASTATYYDGVTVAKAEENLFQYSQDFTNNYWKAFSAVTATGNAIVAPDGTTTATQIAANSTGTGNGAFENTVGAPVGSTISVYAKAGDVNYLAIGSANPHAWASFNLSTGTVGNSNACTASIVSVGSGWYRCIMANITSAMTRVLFAMKSTDVTADPWGNGSVTTGNYIYLWGAQLEQRTSVTAYTATTTQPITNYIPVLMTAAAGVARFDHNPTTDESLGLLIEEQRTNLLTYSSEFDNAAWTKSAATITANTVVAPDGTLTGDKLVEDTSASTHRIFGPTFTPSLIAYTFSFYAKASGRQYAFIRLNNAGGDFVGGTVDLATATVTQTLAGTITAQSVGNGWVRVIGTGTPATTATVTPEIRTSNSATYANYTGDGFSGIFIWGAQLEAGSFATSYIPTVASQVTRSADAASMTGTNFSSWYNQGEGSFYSSVLARGYVLNQMLFSATDGTLNKPVQAYFDSASQIQTNVWGNGTVYRAATVNTQIEYALGMQVNNVSVTIGGGNVTTDTSAGPAYSYTQFNIGNRNGSLIFNGTIRKIAYYPMRLTDAQLQALTT